MAPTSDPPHSAATWRRVALYLFLLWSLTAAVALRLWLESRPGPAAPPQPEPPAPDRLVLEPAEFAAIPGWDADDLAEALPALRSSCRVLGSRAPDRPLGPGGIGGTAADWAPFCRAVASSGMGDAAALRALLESELRPWRVTNGGRPVGLFTGYYEPRLAGSRRRRPGFTVPLHARPPDLVTLDLTPFGGDLTGRSLTGRFASGSRFLPYPDRAAIQTGELAGRGLELVWLRDPVDAFFLHIQGSGRVDLAEGGAVRVGYAGQNGHGYTPVGRVLVERGELAADEVSMQSIRDWLAAHPDDAAALMDENRSYVFFRIADELESDDGPVGSLGVPLTAGRSLAVDDDLLPLGAPIFLDALLPDGDGAAGPEAPARRRQWLLVAQDTGGAIRGPVRGDVFWGSGEEAAAIAGRMRHRGRIWLLLPRDLAAETSAVAARAALP